MPAFKNLAGRQFGRWTVLDQWERRRRPSGVTAIYWRCLCSCGREGWQSSSTLGSGNSRSCGCLKDEVCIKRSTTHGQASRKSRSREYSSWACMLNRTYNPNSKCYDRYGGRGVKVCDRWKDSFENFFADMGNKPSPDLSLDRIDPNGDYIPSNCRWASITTQARNKSTTINVNYQGTTMSLAEACELAGVTRKHVYGRMHKRHLSFDQALESIAGGHN